ncbi:MAG: tripartite tricarboxylate transporter substrate binding protein [Comamonadaceae bacterium]|nr:MAG: tripartite tricarboxylate transporter substrate binding protein [Comamonadaceae bacterium]
MNTQPHSIFHLPARAPRARFAALALMAIVAFGATPLLAQAAGTYPDKPITLVIPFPPGGSTDLFARSMARALQQELKQTVVSENRAGAGGNIGVGYAARAQPDGYTLVLGTIGTQSINQFLYKDMPFDPERDFVPIALVATTPNIIAVNAASPIKSLPDLIAAAKRSKEKPMSYASPGVGSSVHLTGAFFEQAAGISLLHVPFKGVSGSLPAVVGGQVDILMDNLPSTLAQVKDGSKVRAIAVTSAKRAPQLPDVPTAVESGVKDLDVTAWFALYAPKGTPQPVVDTLIEASRRALVVPELVSAFDSLGAQPGTRFGPELAAFERAERQRWSGVVKARGIEAQ